MAKRGEWGAENFANFSNKRAESNQMWGMVPILVSKCEYLFKQEIFVMFIRQPSIERLVICSCAGVLFSRTDGKNNSNIDFTIGKKKLRLE